jgi:hypothetical protein
MSNKKQTAVDWFFSELERMQYFIGNDMLQAYKDAKEMDKQQKIDAYNQGRHNGQVNWGVGNDITAEQYYKENYE